MVCTALQRTLAGRADGPRLGGNGRALGTADWGYDLRRIPEGEEGCMSAEEPASHGESTHGLRGDYSRMRPDYTVDQDYASYADAQQDRWRRLYHRQIALVPGRPCPEYESALRSLDYASGIPRFDVVNR